MAAISKPVAFLGILAVAVAIYAYAVPQDDDKPKPTSHAKKKLVAASDEGWDFPTPVISASYPKPTKKPRDIFLPAIKVLPSIKLPTDKEDVVQIPSNYAEGEGGWAYTGMAEVDGVRMALLENSATKKSGYVREGDDWKKSHVVGITTACIVLTNEKGVAQTVYRFNPNDPPKPKPVPEGGFAPLNPGQIGPGGIPGGGRIGGPRNFSAGGGSNNPDSGVGIRPIVSRAAVSFGP